MPLPISRSYTWEKKKMIHPSSLKDRSSTPPTRSSTSDLDKSTSNSLKKKVRCYFNSYTTYEQPKMSRFRMRRRSFQHQRNQLPQNKWEEHEEFAKDEPTPPKTSPQTKQVWKQKVATYELPSLEVQPSRSPSPGPIDAPRE